VPGVLNPEERQAVHAAAAVYSDLGAEIAAA